jgi:transposase-like protein
MTIHAAFRAGATVTDVAAATGLNQAEVVRRWMRWTNVQTTLIIAGPPSVGSEEVRTIRQRIGEEVNP